MNTNDLKSPDKTNTRLSLDFFSCSLIHKYNNVKKTWVVSATKSSPITPATSQIKPACA